MENLSLQSKIRIGTDIVYMPRLLDKLDDKQWIHRILTPNEQALYHSLSNPKRKLEFMSGRYAAKEAYAKAWGTGIGAIDFLDVEILYDIHGKPISNKMEVSISHDHEYVIAMVLIYENI